METSLFSLFENGTLAVAGESFSLAALDWQPHPEFPGVSLKHVAGADKTGGLFTCHLVRIEPGKAIGMHTHPSSIELHEVMGGQGSCVTEQGEIVYSPGSMAVLPANSPHEVRAGGQGLYLFAKFINIPG